MSAKTTHVFASNAMFEPLGTPRKLPFPLYNQETNGNIVPDLGLEPQAFAWPEDPEERTVVPFLLSQREFTALLSAIDVGADIAYPLQYIEVYSLFVRSVIYKVPICDLIADCIANNVGTQGAIRNFITNDSTLRQWVENQIPVVPASQLGTNFGDVPSCNPDNLFNVCTIAVDILNASSEDIFDVLEVATNSLERAELFVSGIPVVGAVLPFDEVLSLADKFISSFQEAYLAAYTETLEDDIRCGLFCASYETCELTIDNMISYYEAQFALSLPQDIVEAFRDVLAFLLDGSFSGDTIVYGMHLLVLTAIRLSQDVMGLNFADLALRLVAAADNGNDDWAVLCDDCAPEAFCSGGTEHDFRVEMTPWTIFNSRGTWVADAGVRRSDGNQVYVSVDKAGSFNVSKVKVATTSDEMGTLTIFRRDGGGVSARGNTSTAVPAAGGGFIYEVNTTSWSTSGMAGMIVQFQKGTAISGSAFIQKVCYE